MRKFLLTFLLISVLICSFSLNISAQTPSVVEVETPVSMSYVRMSDGNYEYSVKVNATVKKDGAVSSSEEVSILMFGSKDNSDFVSGNTSVNLNVDTIAANYYIYYINQDATDENGKVSFEFNVILPTPASDDKYYIWVGAMEAEAPAQSDREDLEVTSKPHSVSVSLSESSVTAGTNVTLTPVVSNLFAEEIAAETASVDYIVKKGEDSVNGVVLDGVLSTASLEGDYLVYARITREDGTYFTSEPASLSISANTEIKGLLGDPDGDGKITVFDAIAVLCHVSGIETFTEDQLVLADVDKIAGVGVTDSTAILKYVARIINSF